jgi:MFS transporter, DHA2 family, multidrug resistance protein
MATPAPSSSSSSTSSASASASTADESSEPVGSVDAITGSKAAITAVVMAAALMAMIDITIVNVALSDIRASFGTPIDQIGWVSTGYMMANIVVIPMTGWFQRRFGFRRYFAASVLLFTVASALCGLAWSLPSLVVFRMIQGLGGGAIIPTAQTILFARYPLKERGMAAAFFGLGAITGPLLGPTIGGYLIEWFDWHFIFLVNVPLGLAVIAGIWKVLEQPYFRPPTGNEARIDGKGIALLAVGMASLQYVLEEGNREGWLESRLIVTLAAIAAVCLITFVVHELETDNPVVDLRVFRNATYTAGTGLNFLTGFALFAGSFLFSLFCGSVMRYSALDTGKVFLVAGTASLLVMPIMGKISGKVDGRLLLFIGITVVAGSQWMASSLTGAAGFGDLVRPNLVRSAGLGFIFIPVSVLALSDLPASQRGNATGLFNLTRELGGSLGTAVMGTMVTNGTKFHASVLSSHLTPYDNLVQDQLQQLSGSIGAYTFSKQMVGESILALRVQSQAAVLAFDDGFRLVSAALLLGVLLLPIMKKVTGPVDTSAAH